MGYYRVIGGPEQDDSLVPERWKWETDRAWNEHRGQLERGAPSGYSSARFVELGNFGRAMTSVTSKASPIARNASLKGGASSA